MTKTPGEVERFKPMTKAVRDAHKAFRQVDAEKAVTEHEIVQKAFSVNREELSLKVGDGGNRKGGISWGCSTPPLLHRRSDMPCPKITSSS
jgi:hypothetical protein